MILLWIAVVIAGTFMTIYGSHRLSNEWSKKDVIRQAHTIPDFILIDFEVEAEFDEDLRDKILTECKSKIHVPKGSVNNLKEIPLSTFFAENLYKESKSAKKNYKLDKSIYENIKSFDIIGMLKSIDSSTIITIRKNNNKILLSTLNSNTKDSYIEVREYNTKTDRFKLLFNNIQLNVEFLRQSKFVVDLNNGKTQLTIITKPTIQITEIKNVVFKTNSTKYLTLTDIKKNELGGYTAKTKLLLR